MATRSSSTRPGDARQGRADRHDRAPRPPRPDADDRQAPARPGARAAPRRRRTRAGRAGRRADRRARSASTPSTPRRSSGPARRRRRSPRPRGLQAAGRARPARVRLRRLDRRRAEEADEAARVAHRAAGAVDVPLPGRRELHRDAAPHRRRRSTRCAPRTPAARSCACRTPTRSRPPSPTPSAPTSTCSSASSSAPARSARSPVAGGGPVVLAVNSTGGSLTRAAAVMRCDTMSVFFEFDEVDTFTAGGDRRARARASSTSRPAPGSSGSRVKCEKQQVAAIAQYLRTVLQRPAAARGPPDAGALELREPVEQVVRARPDRARLRPRQRPPRSSSSRSSCRRRRRRGRATRTSSTTPTDRGHVRLYVTRSQAAAFCDHADELVAAGRPTCQWCGNPIDPDGHPCPRMN